MRSSDYLAVIGWNFPTTVIIIITEMIERDTLLFSVQLRKATKNVHDVSDALVNAKLGVTINDDSVWAEGLLVFYEVFKVGLRPGTVVFSNIFPPSSWRMH